MSITDKVKLMLLFCCIYYFSMVEYRKLVWPAAEISKYCFGYIIKIYDYKGAE